MPPEDSGTIEAAFTQNSLFAPPANTAPNQTFAAASDAFLLAAIWNDDETCGLAQMLTGPTLQPQTVVGAASAINVYSAYRCSAQSCLSPIATGDNYMVQMADLEGGGGLALRFDIGDDVQMFGEAVTFDGPGVGETLTRTADTDGFLSVVATGPGGGSAWRITVTVEGKLTAACSPSIGPTSCLTPVNKHATYVVDCEPLGPFDQSANWTVQCRWVPLTGASLSPPDSTPEPGKTYPAVTDGFVSVVLQAQPGSYTQASLIVFQPGQPNFQISTSAASSSDAPASDTCSLIVPVSGGAQFQVQPGAYNPELAIHINWFSIKP